MEAAESPQATSELHTFLIADIRGYTQFTLQHGDEAAARLATVFAGITERAVAERGGEVIELRGDEALAVFSSARQALHAAIELQAQFRRTEHEDVVLPLRVGIGLDAGEAVPVRGGYRGAALNLAARLCSLAGPGEVLASEAVTHLARRLEGIDYVQRGLVELKGFADPVQVMEILAPAGKSDAPGDIGTSTSEEMHEQSLPIGGFLGSLPTGSLVARDRELDEILRAVEAAAVGQGRLVMLVGEPGVGKTRLAQEATITLRNRGFLLASGRCYEPQSVVAFYPFLDVLAAVYDAAPGALRAEAGKRWPYLGQLLPDRIGMHPVESGSPEDQQRLFRTIASFLQAVAKQRPIAVLLDDLHWADGSSLDLLQHLVRSTRGDRILYLCTYRDVEVSRKHPLEAALRDLNREDLTHRIDVRRLPIAGTGALIAATMGGEEVSEEFMTLLHGKTEGNPFFVQQVLRVLVERGDIFRRANTWDRRAVEEIEVPESVRSVVGQRVARLRDQTQTILQQASVLGQTFRFDELLALADLEEAELESALDEAADVGVLRPAGRDGYAFDHALTQQSLYEELSPRKQRRLHLAAARVLESLPTLHAQREGRSGEIAWHFLEGDDPERALVWSLQAGHESASLFAHADAIRHYETSAELAQETGDTSRQAEATEKLAGSLGSMARFEEAIARFREAATLYHVAGLQDAELRSLANVALALGARGEAQEGIALLEGALGEVDTSSSSGGLGTLYLALAYTLWSVGRYPESVAAARQASAIAESIGDDRLWGQAQLRLGTAVDHTEGPARATEVLEAALPVVERVGDMDTLATMTNNLAFMYSLQGELARNLAYRQRAAELAITANVPTGIVWSQTMIGQALYFLGRYDEAASHVTEALDRVQSLEHTWISSYPYLEMAEIGVTTGEWEKAANHLRHGADMAEANGDIQAMALARKIRGDWEILRGEPHATIAWYEELEAGEHSPWTAVTTAWAYQEAGQPQAALDVAKGHLPSRFWSSRARWIRGTSLRELGKLAEAESELREALHEFRSMNSPLEEGLALHDLGVLEARNAHLEAARHMLFEAEAIFERIGARPYTERTRSLLKSLAL